MKKLLLIWMLAAALVFAASMAYADPVDPMLAFDTVLNEVTLNISSGGTPYNNVEAGNYILYVGTVPGPTISTYCISTLEATTSLQPYTVTPITTLSSTALQEVAWIVQQGYTTDAAEAQVAVWSLVLPSFSYTSPSAAFTNEVNAILTAAAAGYASLGTDDVAELLNPTYQSYVGEVPICSTLLLLGTGLAGLGGLRRWKGSLLT